MNQIGQPTISSDAVAASSGGEFPISRETRTRHCRGTGLRSIRENPVSRNTMQLKMQRLCAVGLAPRAVADDLSAS